MKKLLLLLTLVVLSINAHAKDRPITPECSFNAYTPMVMFSLKTSDEFKYLKHLELVKVQQTLPETITKDRKNEASICNVLVRMSNTGGTKAVMFQHRYRLTYKTSEPDDLRVFVKTVKLKSM
ncbi:hypothetical protein F9883_18715 [Morganella morganii]|uniref:hypothetical protein n=1 Tax=Morganella morganii TaxID=582 RepID=UPI0015F433A5|nr:hypothetical protein [Morganella morganii]MBA5809892.1 hypothetical protein [Morganella morganii]